MLASCGSAHDFEIRGSESEAGPSPIRSINYVTVSLVRDVIDDRDHASPRASGDATRDYDHLLQRARK